MGNNDGKYGVRVKVGIAATAGNDLRKEIENAISKTPIKLSKFEISPAVNIGGLIQSQIDKSNISIKIKNVDVSDAVKKINSQLGNAGHMLDGGVSSSSTFVSGTSKIIASQHKVSKFIDANQRALSALSRSADSIISKVTSVADKKKGASYLKEHANIIGRINKARSLNAAGAAAEKNEIADEIRLLKQKVDLTIASERAAAKEAKVRSKGSKDAKFEIEKSQNAMKRLLSSEAGMNKTFFKNVEKYLPSKEVDKLRGQFRSLYQDMANYNSKGDKTNSEIMSHYKDRVKALLDLGNAYIKAGKDQERLNAAISKRQTAEKVFVEKYGKVGGFLGRAGNALGGLEGFAIKAKSIQLAIKAFKEMLHTIKQVDDAMTELRKVTDLTDISYQNVLRDSSKMATTTGTLLPDVVNSIADFSRLGYDVLDASTLARSALVYKNVGDGIENISEATESLISTVKAFNVLPDDSMRIIDMFNAVGNNFAISSSGIGEALRRSAAALAESGNTIQESIGLITAMNSIVQNPEQVGTSLKTLTMYLRAAKTEAQEAGVETEGMATSVSKLRDDLLSLTGVDIMLNNDTFKSTYQIMKELSGVWNDLTDVTKANVLQKIAGKRNSNVVASLLKNFSDAEKAVQVATESENSAIIENEKYLDSITGKITVLKATFQDFATSAISSKFSKSLIDVGVIIGKVLNVLQKVRLLLPTISVAALKIFSNRSRNKLEFAKEGIRGIVSDFGKSISEGLEESIAAEKLRTGLLDPKFLFGKKGARELRDTIEDALRNIDGIDVSKIMKGIDASPIFKNIDEGLDSIGNKSNGIFVGIRGNFKKLISSWDFWVTAAIAAVGLVYSVVEAHNQKIQASIDKSNSILKEYEASNRDHNSNIERLESMKSRFDELSKGIGEQGRNIGLTSAEYREYKALLSEIIGISPDVVLRYDEQGKAILNYKTVLDDAIQYQKSFIENSKQIFLNSLPEVYTGKVNEFAQYFDSLVKNNEGYKKFFNIFYSNAMVNSFGSPEGFSVLNKSNSPIVDFINQIAHEIGIIEDQENISYTWLQDYNNIKKLYDNRKNLILEMRREILSEPTRIQDDLNNAMTGANAPKSPFIEYITESDILEFEQYLNGISAEIGQLEGLRFQAADLVFNQLYNTEGKGGIGERIRGVTAEVATEIKNGIRDSIDLDAGFYSNVVDATNFANAFISGIESAGNEIRERANGKTFLEWAGVINESGESGSLDNKAFLAQVNDYKDEVDSFVNELANTDPLVADYIGKWLYGLIDGAQIATDEIGNVIPEITGLSAAIKSVNDGYDLLNKAVMEQSGGRGLSADTINSLIGSLSDGESISDYLSVENGVITLNIEKWKERAEAIANNDVEALKSEKRSLYNSISEIRESAQSNGRLLTTDESNEINSYTDRIIEINKELELYNVLAEDAKNPFDEASGSAKGFAKVINDLVASASNIKDPKNLTYSEYESLIDVDGRYANVIEYSNGVMSINEEKHKEITETILNEVKARAALQKSVLLSNPEYVNLKAMEASGGLLNDIDSARLSGFEVAISNYNAIINETGRALGSIKIGDIEESAESASEKMYGLSKAMKSVNDSYELLNKASIEQNKNGRLSRETVSDIVGSLDETESASDYLIYQNGIIKLNTEAWKERANAIIESDRASLKAQRDAITQEMNEYIQTQNANGGSADNDILSEYIYRIQQIDKTISLYEYAISGATDATIRARSAAESMSAAFKNLNGATSDIGETTQITYDKYLSLIDIDQRYASAIEYQNGVLVLNKNKHADITNSILEETRAIAESEKNLILHNEEYLRLKEKWESNELTNASDIQKLLDYEVNIQGFNALTHEIDNATSAYERWLNRSGDTGNDRYSQALKAFELINNTLNKKDSEYYGRVGREEFGQAVDFVIGEHVDVNTEEFDRAFKVVKRYMTEDAKGATAFYDDLVKHGLLDGTTGALNATIEEISSALGISEEMVRTMIDRLNEYQDDDNKITVAEPTVEVEGSEENGQNVIERLITDLGEAQQSINELSSTKIDLSFNDKDQVLSDLQVIDSSLNSISKYKNAIGEAVGSADENIISSISFHLKNAENAIDTINREKLNLDVSGAEGAVGAVESAVHTLAISLNSVEYILSSSIPAGINSVNGKELSIDTVNTVSRLGSVFSSLTSIANKLDQIRRNNSITVSINEVTTKSTRYSGNGYNKSSANGGASAYGGIVPGGKTLVGELGMETVVDPEQGIWYTVGDRGAEFVNLPKNAIVFDHLQTEDLLGIGSTGNRGFALASGNAAAVPRRPITVPGANRPSNSDIVNGSGIKRPGSSSSSSSKKKHSSSSSSSHSHHHHHSSSSSHKSSSTFESLLKKYQELTDQTEHLIEHQEFLYEQGKRGLDYSKMEQSLQEQTKLYKKIMTDAQAGIAALTAKGAKDTDKELQEMERIYWEAYKNLYGTLDEINKLYVDGLNEKIDGIQDAYSDLAKASKEYNDYGGVTIDTLQNIVDNGLQYMSLLKNENGQFVINEDAIQKLIAAEKEQLAIETALSYLNQVKLALGNEDKNLVENLVDLSNKLSESTWDAVYAQAALLKGAGLTDDQFKKIVANIDAFRAISGSALTDISKDVDKVAGDRDKINSDQKDALDEILSLTEDLIKAETEDRIDAIEDEIDAYKEIIDLKKESLQTTKDEDDYQKNVAEKIKEIAELQRRIDQLKLDDSREARAERAKLEEELSGLQGELGEIQSDHSLDKQLETLDKTAEEYEENRQKEIDALEDSISSAEKLYQLSIDRIKNGWDTLYEDLIKWNTESGSSLNSEITENWEKAAEAVKKYGSFLEALNKLDKDKGGSSSGSGSNTIVGEGELTNPDTLNPPKPVEPDKPAPEEKPKKVKIVRGTWNVRTGASTKYHSVGYAREGQVYDYAGETLGDWLAIIYKGEKRWMHKGGSKLYDALPTYHRGGVVGKAGAINDKEVVAVLEKDELVLDKKKKNALYKAIDFHKFLSEKLGAVSGSLSMSGLQLAPAFAGAMRQVSGTTNIGNIVFNVDVNGVGDVSSTNATAFGKKIASSAMDELYDAFQRRGIGHIFGTKLKK